MTAAQPKIVSTTEYKIEKNVPPPRSGLHSGDSTRKYPFDRMEVGDSVVVPPLGRSAAYAFAKKHSLKFRASELSDGNYRVWRLA